MIIKTLSKIQNGEHLSEKEMISCMTQIMEGLWRNEQIAAFLMGLSVRGETVDEIVGAAKVMRDKAIHINAPEGAVDCCGTGGDKSGTYNISTAVAIVLAACGIPVAKHGNRSASSKSGAADVLEELGVNLNTPQKKLEEALRLFNFAFLMAPNHHGAMKYVTPVRKLLGIRTIFNILGPLANPAKTKFQLLGVYDKKLILPMAQALEKLGTKNAWVVHGSDGLDEITVTGKTFIAKLNDGAITQETITPEEFGLPVSYKEELNGGTPQENAHALREVLCGKKNAYRNIVIANASAVLVISGKEKTIKNAVNTVSNVLDNGKALKLLEDYVTYTIKC